MNRWRDMGGRDLVGYLLDKHLHRTGTTQAYREDAYTKTTVDYARNVLRLVAAAMDDEGIDEDTARRVVERVIYGAVPSPADVDYRKDVEARLLKLIERAPVLSRVVLDDKGWPL